MKGLLALVAPVVMLSACPVFAQTADHAPTKPAADAAARYDKSVERPPPANGANGSDGSSSGASTGTDAPETKHAPANGGTAAPNPNAGQPK